MPITDPGPPSPPVTVPAQPFAVDNLWFSAAIWMVSALASALAIRLNLASALVEILFGVLAGNLVALHSNALG